MCVCTCMSCRFVWGSRYDCMNLYLSANTRFGLVYWGLTPQQQPGSYQGGEMMMMMTSVFWWRKPYTVFWWR